MKFRGKLIFILILMTTVTMLVFPGCGKSQPKSIKIGVVDWPECYCMTEIVKLVLEEKMNFPVEIINSDVDTVYQKLAENKCDIFLDCWLPITHDKFISQYGSDIENLGVNFRGARTGLAVPSYVSIESISQLNTYKDKFNSTIVGIEAEAGIIKSTQKAIKEYNLDFSLSTSCSNQMEKRIEEAIGKKEWIVVTGWIPHWKFAQWDLFFLDDPLFIYGGEENLHTVTRKGFAREYPKIAEFLYNFHLEKDELVELLLLMNNNSGDNTEKAFVKWISEHKETVDTWLYSL